MIATRPTDMGAPPHINNPPIPLQELFSGLDWAAKKCCRRHNIVRIEYAVRSKTSSTKCFFSSHNDLCILHRVQNRLKFLIRAESEIFVEQEALDHDEDEEKNDATNHGSLLDC